MSNPFVVGPAGPLVGLFRRTLSSVRRPLVALLAGASLAFAATAADRPDGPEPLRLGLHRAAQPEHGGLYQGVVEGHYRACGLDVEIVPGGPGVDHRASLLAGTVDVHVGASLLGALLAVEQGLPVRVVSASFQKDPLALVAHPDSEFEEWNDLLGAERYLLSDAAFRTYFRWMAADHGFDASRRVPLDAEAAASFLTDPRAVRQGYATSDAFEIERALGRAPEVFLFAENGLDGYAMTTEVLQRTLDERPEAIRCLVEATARGWEGYLHGDGARANAAIRAANPDVTDEQIAFAIDRLKAHGIVEGGDAALRGIGAMRAERVRAFHDAMVDAGVLSESLDVERAYTLEYLDGGVRPDPEARP